MKIPKEGWRTIPELKVAILDFTKGVLDVSEKPSASVSSADSCSCQSQVAPLGINLRGSPADFPSNESNLPTQKNCTSSKNRANHQIGILTMDVSKIEQVGVSAKHRDSKIKRVEQETAIRANFRDTTLQKRVRNSAFRTGVHPDLGKRKSTRSVIEGERSKREPFCD